MCLLSFPPSDPSQFFRMATPPGKFLSFFPVFKAVDREVLDNGLGASKF